MKAQDYNAASALSLAAQPSFLVDFRLSKIRRFVGLCGSVDANSLFL